MVNGRSRKKGKGRKGARVRRRTVNGREREEAMREESPAKEIRIQSPGPPESILLSVDEPADDPQGTIDADELPSEPPLMPPKMRKKWFDRTDLTFSTTAASGNEGGEAEVDASPVDDMTQDEAPTQAVDSSRDSRPIFHRRKDHLIDRTFQSEAVDSEAGNSQISPDANTLESEPVAGPSTSKLDAQAPPPPIASPSTHFAKLSLVSPGTGAYAVIGSKTASISEVLDVGSSKGKGKENVMEDVAGSPRMSWSAFTRKEFEGEHGDIEDTVDEVIKEVTRPEEEVVEGRVHPEEEAFPDEATSPTPAIHPPVTPTTHPPVPLPPTAHISAAISPPEETASATPIAATDTDIEMEDLQLPSLPQLPVEAENQPPSPPFVHESLSPMSSIVSPTAPPPTTLTVDTRPPCSVQSPSPTPVSPLSPSPPYLGEDLHFSDHGPLSPLTSPPSPHRLPLEPSPADNALSLPPTNDSITHIHEHSPLSPMSTIPSSPMMEGGDLMSGIQDEQPNEGGKSTTSIASSLNSPVSPTPNVVIRSPSPPLHSPVVPVQGTPSESHIDRSPPPPPSAPKVKMSLKDFALRKKKQREELTRSIQTSPLSVASVLAPSPVGTNEVLTPSPKVSSTTLLSSPLVTNSQLAIDDGQESRAVDAVNHDSPAVVKHINASPDNIQFDKQQPISINVDEDPPMVPTKINGHHPPPLLSSTLHNAKLTLTPSPPPLLNIKSAPSPPLIQEVTREAKVELVEQSVPLEPSPLPNDAPAVVSVVSVTSSRDVPKSVGNIHVPPLADQPQLRRISQQEEGEIGEASPPPPPPKRFDSYRPLRTSPPTHPRSFQAAMSPPGGGRPSPASAPPYRSSGSSFSSSPSTAGLTSRPVPSAPRALRNGIPPSQSSQSSYVPPSRTFSGSSYIPRGPSADRDRQDRDRGDRWPPYRNRRWAR